MLGFGAEDRWDGVWYIKAYDVGDGVQEYYNKGSKYNKLLVSSKCQCWQKSMIHKRVSWLTGPNLRLPALRSTLLMLQLLLCLLCCQSTNFNLCLLLSLFLFL